MPTRRRRRLGYGGGAVEKVVSSDIVGYTPLPAPEDKEDLRRYIDDELHRIRDAFDEIYDEAPEEWHVIGDTGEPAFENSWVNLGGTAPLAAFYIDNSSRVYVKGHIKTGASGTDAFTLPVGYRPSETFWFVINSTDWVIIDTDGTVNVTRGGTNALFGNISFRV